MNWKMLTAASCTVLGFMLQGSPVKAVKTKALDLSAQSATVQNATKRMLAEEMPYVADMVQQMDERLKEMAVANPEQYAVRIRELEGQMERKATPQSVADYFFADDEDNRDAVRGLFAAPAASGGEWWDETADDLRQQTLANLTDQTMAAVQARTTAERERDAAITERDDAREALNVARMQRGTAGDEAIATSAHLAQIAAAVQALRSDDTSGNGWFSPAVIAALQAQIQTLQPDDTVQALQRATAEQTRLHDDLATLHANHRTATGELAAVQRDIQAIIGAVRGNPGLATGLHVDANTDLTDPGALQGLLAAIQNLRLIDPNDHTTLQTEFIAEQQAHARTQQAVDRLQDVFGQVVTRLQLPADRQTDQDLYREIARLQQAAQTPPDLSQFAGVAGLGATPTLQDIHAQLLQQNQRGDNLHQLNTTLLADVNNITAQLQLHGDNRTPANVLAAIANLQQGAPTPSAAQLDLSDFARVAGLSAEPTLEEIRNVLEAQRAAIDRLTSENAAAQRQNAGGRGRGGKRGKQ